MFICDLLNVMFMKMKVLFDGLWIKYRLFMDLIILDYDEVFICDFVVIYVNIKYFEWK